MISHRQTDVIACLALATTTLTVAAQQAAPHPLCEFRGAWVATVDNIDWPSRPGLPTAQAQQELLDIVERAALLRMNALVFQVRPNGDALYRSTLEPWSEWLTGAQGRAPAPLWDPLEFLIAAAHPRGLEVHAWCNPYRARHPAARSPEAPTHVCTQLPAAVVQYGSYRWMDPGHPAAADWSLRVMLDLVTRYDLDGIHIDDYFYPYPEKDLEFPDDRSYAAYRRGGGTLRLDDWRRQNIDSFVRRLYEQTHRNKPWVKVGISPFGIARPGVPAGIKAGIDQYSQLYADVLGWQRDGLCDYLSPQLYWPIDQAAQSFAVLFPWWQSQNPHRRHMWPGLSAGRAAAGKRPWRRRELSQQIEMIRAQGAGKPGHVLFSFRALTAANGLAAELLEEVYRAPAPVPASPWLDCPLPAAPTVEVTAQGADRLLRVQVDEAARFYCVQSMVDDLWQTTAVRGPQRAVVQLPAGAQFVTVRGIARNGVFGPSVTVAVAR